MVCEVCSVDRSDDGELVILDYPMFVAAESPCPNCGGGVPRAKSVVMSDLASRGYRLTPIASWSSARLPNTFFFHSPSK